MEERSDEEKVSFFCNAVTYLKCSLLASFLDRERMLLFVPLSGAKCLDMYYDKEEVWMVPELQTSLDYRDERLMEFRDITLREHLEKEGSTVIIRGEREMPREVHDILGGVEEDDMVMVRLSEDMETIEGANKVSRNFWGTK